MKIELINENIVYPFLMIDDFYDEREQELIWQEFEFLRVNLDRLDTATAVDKDGLRLASKHSVFLDDVYKERRFSNVFNFYSVKIFSEEVLEAYKAIPSCDTFFNCNRDNTLLNYYEDGDYYKPHYDAVHHSCIVWFIREPKVWSGGDFVFENSGIKVECIHNRMVLFPSYYLHGANPVVMKEEDKNKGLGRYSMAHFFDVFNNHGDIIRESNNPKVALEKKENSLNAVQQLLSSRL